jgi:hypothetical protein
MSPTSTSIESLFATPAAADLGPRARSGVWTAAEAEEKTGAACASAHVRGTNADCLRALVLLWHDHLDDAHRIVQDLSGAEAAFVHGIMHRREPDLANARYWFQRVGRHPVFEWIAEAAAPLLAAHPALPYRLIHEGTWDPYAFIDAIAVVSREPESSPEARLFRELQRQESLVLARHLAGGRNRPA